MQVARKPISTDCMFQLSFFLPNISDLFLKYIPLLFTVVDRDVAWNQIKSITGFGPGGSKSNSLFWAASRNPPPPNYNGSAHGVDIKGIIKQACSANSACDAVGKIYTALIYETLVE